MDAYKIGCKYTTPERFNFHMGLETGNPLGPELGQIFDDTYVKRVSKETAGLFDGMDKLLRSLAMAGHPQGALSAILVRCPAFSLRFRLGLQYRVACATSLVASAHTRA